MYDNLIVKIPQLLGMPDLEYKTPCPYAPSLQQSCIYASCVLLGYSMAYPSIPTTVWPLSMKDWMFTDLENCDFQGKRDQHSLSENVR